ncbi:BTB/POZ domain-containing protein [Hibiscus syriacus]|uniref:BTB/POZ domain-containing protein n=1 Tax=Hibiscus syriacus TaxID=106335 RepID=A0A6A2YJR2_HIBSY|nr:BTB/POZ domain-containing protein [Hibiscus syriacus]
MGMPISDVSSDLKIEIGASSFSLHKFPQVSWSGRIRKLLVDAKDAKISRINLSYFPGGPEAFELVAKFCYGIDVEITLLNVAVLRCVSRYLEMGEEFAEKNLEARTEAYLKDVVLLNISSTIAVLHRCENLLPISEEINLVNRVINAIANNACKEQLTSGLLEVDHNFPSKAMSNTELETPSDWRGKSLAVLNIEFFKRVLLALKSKGLRQDTICKILINYTHNSLQSLVIRDHHLLTANSIEEESGPHGISLEFTEIAIASLLSTSCKLDLERRTGLQLDQAILEDIPANSHGNNHTSVYDTETVLRIFSIFLNLGDADDDEDNPLRDEIEMAYDFDDLGSPKQSSILKVSKLLDSYLAEVVVDTNLSPLKFIALVELLPDHACIVSDGLYRAVDNFLMLEVEKCGLKE